MGGGGGYTIHLSYGWVVEEVILPVEEVILFCGGGYTPCGGGYSHSCDFSVSPSPLGLDFGTLDFGTSDLGLTISKVPLTAALPVSVSLT